MKLNTSKFKKIILFIILIIILVFYISLINSSFSSKLESIITNKYKLDNINLKDNLYYTSSINNIDNNIIDVSDISISDEIIEDNPPIIYIYNTHDTEKYSSPFTSDYTITPDVKIASYILKDHLNDLGINSYVETKSISEYLKTHNLNYNGSYRASREYMLEELKNHDYKILIDIHRDSVNYKYTLYEKNNKKYARIMFVLATKHDNYEKNREFINYINDKLNDNYKGISRGIMIRENEVFNQDLSENAILIELGGVDNTIEEINNSLEVLANILNEYILERDLYGRRKE